MQLLRRLWAMLRADAHSALDVLEDKRALLKQALRDAEGELQRKRILVEGLRSEEERLELELSQLDDRLDALEEDVTLALGACEEDLARFAISKLLPLRRERENLLARTEAITTEREDIERRLLAQKKHLDQLRARARSRLLGANADPAARSLVTLTETVAEEEVELELLRRKDAVQQASLSPVPDQTGADPSHVEAS